MGHQIYHQTYSEKVNRQQVQRYWDNVAMHDDWEEGCTGLPANIRWIENHICDSLEDAEAYIREHDRGWYDQLAIRYKQVDKSELKSAARNRLIKQIASYKDKAVEYDSAHSVIKLKAEYITCPRCGSKLAKAYLGRDKGRVKANGCPVCECSDIRAEYIVNQLKSFQDKILKWQTDLKAEEKKLAKKAADKAKIMWLVKVEYHV